jgi:hypothetical protein
MRFAEVLDAADQLSLDEQTTLVDVLNRRLVERRRDRLAEEIQQARREYAEGQCQPATPDQILKDLLS